MATDSKGNTVGFGDWVIAEVPVPMTDHEYLRGVFRIVKLSETPKGTAAVGAFVDLVGNGRIAKVKVDVATSTLVLRSNGEGV